MCTWHQIYQVWKKIQVSDQGVFCQEIINECINRESLFQREISVLQHQKEKRKVFTRLRMTYKGLFTSSVSSSSSISASRRGTLIYTYAIHTKHQRKHHQNPFKVLTLMLSLSLDVWGELALTLQFSFLLLVIWCFVIPTKLYLYKVAYFQTKDLFCIMCILQ